MAIKISEYPANLSETFGSDAFMFTVEELERFAALVAAHVRETEFKPDWNNYRQGLADGAAEEREACAKVCDDIDVEYDGEDVLATLCAAAIRARSEV